MKKNIILIIVVLILLVVVGWLSYNYGIQEGKKKEMQNVVPNELETKYKNNPSFLQCLEKEEKKCLDSFILTKKLVDPQSLKECNQLLTDDARENCRMIFVIKQVKESGDKKECLALKDENNKKSCEISAFVTNVIKKETPETCNNLEGAEINSCLSQVIAKIIKTNPDAKWCNYLKDIQGPDRDSCLLDVKEIKQQQATAKLLDME